MNQIIKRFSRHVVSVGRQHATHGGERKLQRIIFIENPGHTRLVGAKSSHIVLDAELAKNCDQARNERLADNHVGPLAIIEKHDIHTLTGQQAGECGTCRTGTDDANAKGFLGNFHKSGRRRIGNARRARKTGSSLRHDLLKIQATPRSLINWSMKICRS